MDKTETRRNINKKNIKKKLNKERRMGMRQKSGEKCLCGRGRRTGENKKRIKYKTEEKRKGQRVGKDKRCCNR